MYTRWLTHTLSAFPDMPLCMLCQVFLGSLREAEVERINDRISQAIMETCLAMTIFREEFNVEFCAMFTVRSSYHAAALRSPLLQVAVARVAVSCLHIMGSRLFLVILAATARSLMCVELKNGVATLLLCRRF